MYVQYYLCYPHGGGGNIVFMYYCTVQCPVLSLLYYIVEYVDYVECYIVLVLYQCTAHADPSHYLK